MEPLATSSTETLHLAIYIHCNQGQSTCTAYSLKHVNDFRGHFQTTFADLNITMTLTL